jgi:phosphopantothenoylcysteine decarboxylase/phosphopantothenate--cysteine ligase
LDPVRFLGNRSSGRMGYALARAARDRGARVILVSTVGLPAPTGIDVLAVETAGEMLDAVLGALPEGDVLLMAAAVADYRPAAVAAQKIKKTEGDLKLDLVRTPDILARVAEQRRSDQVIAGFAAETENLVENARAKLARKRLDLIVANDARQAMGAATNKVTLVAAGGRIEELPLLPKEQVAEEILERVVALLSPERHERVAV